MQIQSAFARPRAHAEAGFTLIEMMVAVAIVAILLAMAAPSFTSTIARGRVTSATNDMVSALSNARTEAIRRGKRVTLCRSSNGTSCTTTAGTGWEVGWIMFEDTTRATGNNDNAAVDGGETIIGRGAASGNSVVIYGNSVAANFVSFAADGTAKRINGTALDSTGVTIRVCTTSRAVQDTARARDITVNMVGRVASATVSTLTYACTAPA